MDVNVFLQRANGQLDRVSVPFDAIQGTVIIEYDRSFFIYQPGGGAFSEPVFNECPPPLTLQAPPDAGRKFFGQQKG